MKHLMLLILTLFVLTCNAAKFDKFFPHLIKAEGIIFTVTQYDRGGATKFGVTLRTYLSYCNRSAICDKNKDGVVNVSDLALTSLNDVNPIYYYYYWKPYLADSIRNQAIAELLVDMYINCGTGKRREHIKFLQSYLRIKQDGRIGSKTLLAINTAKQKNLYKYIYNYRVRYYKAIGVGKQRKFLRGWLNRIQKLKQNHQDEKLI